MEEFILNLLDSVGNIDFTFVSQIFMYSLIGFWFVVLYWVWLDSGERTSNKFYRFLYVLLVALLNLVGWVIYLIVRPSQTIEEIYWSDLERRYLKYETAELGDCPQCGAQLYPGFKFCPSCKYQLKRKCPGCGVRIDKKNKYCPYCGAEARIRLAPEQISPTREVMQQQIQATKDEATEAVEAKRTRYSTSKSLTIKVGESIIGGYKIIGAKIKDLFKQKPEEEKEIKQDNTPKSSKKKKKKHSKKKKSK